MKKVLFLIVSLFLTLNLVNVADASRVCETKYTNIGGFEYFAGIHCTEDIKLSGVVGDKPALKDISNRRLNDFLVSNNFKIVEHLNNSGTCDTISDLSEIQSFESVIYSNNGISYSSTSESIESLTEEIENLKETYNDENLYNEVFSGIQSSYPLSSLDSQRNFARDAYFNRQLEIKNQILSKQKEKLTKLYLLQESQKFIENFYKEVNRACTSIAGDVSSGEPKLNDEDLEDEKQEKIEKFKNEFNEKLGYRLDKMSKQVLQSLSIKLLAYAEESPLFKRFSEAQQEMIKLKIAGLKAAVDSRIN